MRAKVLRLALACSVAFGLMPIGAFAEGADGEGGLDASEALGRDNCVIAKPSDPGLLDGEPVVSTLDDALLLSYDTAEQAQEAVERLSSVCEFAEIDAPVMAAGEETRDAAEAGSGQDGVFDAVNDIASGSEAAENDGESPVAPEAGDAMGALGEAQSASEMLSKAKSGEDARDADGEAPSSGEKRPDAPASPVLESKQAAKARKSEESRESSGKDAKVSTPKDHDGVLIALVDSGAPKDGGATKAISVIGDDATDENGHATRMFEAMRAQAPDADILCVRVLDSAGSGTIAAVYAGIKAAIAEGADIINLSLYAALDDNSAAINAAVQEAREAGIVVVAAAGNAGDDASGYVPANAEGVVTVGSCDASGTRLPSSNFGQAVDVYAVSSATSEAAALASGWLAAHEGLADPTRCLKDACGKGVFYETADEPNMDGADVPVPAAVEHDSVMPAMTISEPIKTELRKGGNRAESAVPAQSIVLDNGGELSLSKAEVTGSVAGLERAVHPITSGGIVDAPMYGVWIKNPGTEESSGYQRDVDGTITMKWTDVAADADGNRLDLTMDISNIRICSHDARVQNASAATASKRILLFRNDNAEEGLGRLMLSSRMESVDGKNSRAGVCMTVHVAFHRTGEPPSAKANGTYLFMACDLDQPDCSRWLVSEDVFNGTYAESMQLVSGFDMKTYLQQDIPDDGTSPDPGPSTLRVDVATGKFSAQERNDFRDEFRAGFVASTTGPEFAINWYGSNCDTWLLSDYEGVTIRDKNDPTDNTTDKAVITKTTNGIGQGISDEKSAYDEKDNHGGKRVSTSWRSTDMPWKGSGVYHFGAQSGYRVTKVTVLYKKWDNKMHKYNDVEDVYEGSDLKGLRELSFGSEESDYPVVRDYDIVVTTAKVPDAAVTIAAKKLLQGRSLKAGEFEFSLHEGSKKVGDAHNADDGAITFLPLTYTYTDQAKYPIKHTYVISEEAGNAHSVTYDSSKFEVVVTEDYDAKAHKMKADVSYGKEPVFKNTYAKSGGVRVKKIDASTGRGVKGAEFTVTSATGGLSQTMTSGDDGVAELGATALPEGSYVVRESKAPEGYGLNTEWSAEFSIEEDGVIVDLTDNPCTDEQDRAVDMPKTGGSGVTVALAASLAAVVGGIAVRRRLVGMA